MAQSLVTNGMLGLKQLELDSAEAEASGLANVDLLGQPQKRKEGEKRSVKRQLAEHTMQRVSGILSDGHKSGLPSEIRLAGRRGGLDLRGQRSCH